MSVLSKIGRRRTRGAAMAEAAICLPVMILMWAGVDYFRRGYARRLDTLSQAHAAAWEKAYSNDGSCYSGAGGWSGWTSSASSDLPTEGGETIDKKFSSSMFLYGTAKATKSETVTSSRWSGTVSSSTTVVCNEVVPDKDSDRNVLTPLIDFVKSFL